MRWLITGSIFVNATTCQAQYFDPGAIYNTITSDRYVRLDYDNDFFTKMDYYYSQGIHLEYVNPALGNFVLRKALFSLPNSTTKFGLALDHAAYTPTSIAAAEILATDRPYAATFSATYFSIRTDSVHARRLYAALNLGVIGPWAFGEEMQTGIHRWLDNPLPMGWSHQIKNDLVLNYVLGYQQELWRPGEALQISAVSRLAIGTLQSNAGLGFSIMAGKFIDPYRTNRISPPGRRWQYYFFASPLVHIAGYDATLQGGIFNRSSPYTISAEDLHRLQLRADGGVTVRINGFTLSYTQSIISAEFKAGMHHRWGGFRMGVAL